MTRKGRKLLEKMRTSGHICCLGVYIDCDKYNNTGYEVYFVRMDDPHHQKYYSGWSATFNKAARRAYKQLRKQVKDEAKVERTKPVAEHAPNTKGLSPRIRREGSEPSSNPTNG